MFKEKIQANLVKPWFSWAMIMLSATLYTIGIQMFIQVAGTFSSGLGAFAQIITMIDESLKTYFSIIYLALNVPLLIIFWTRLSKKFRKRTISFLLFQALLGSLFIIPGFNNIFIDHLGMIQTTSKEIRAEVWPIFILAVIGASIVGLAVAVAWKYGASTGGSDIIIYYYSTKKKQSIGSLMFIISGIIIFFSFIFSMLVGYQLKEKRQLWMITLSSTVIYVLIQAVIVDLVYPKYKLVKLEIHSTKYKEIIKYLKQSNYNHSFLITKNISGYTGDEKIIITTVMLLLERKTFIKKINKIDPNTWILETTEKRIHGNFNTQNVD